MPFSMFECENRLVNWLSSMPYIIWLLVTLHFLNYSLKLWIHSEALRSQMLVRNPIWTLFTGLNANRRRETLRTDSIHSTKER